MAVDNQTMESVLVGMRQLSPGDLSILEAVVQSLDSEESVRVTTTPGSANDRVWSEMAGLGWMSADSPLEVPVASKVFIVRAAAKEQLRAVLDEIKRDELPKLFNQLRREIPVKIGPPVIAAAGTPADVSLMLAGIIERTMRNYIKAELHEQLLKDIVQKVQLLQKEN